MTILHHELRRNRLALLIWSIAIASMLFISIIIYPEMRSSMLEATNMFSQMGDFSAAFGMDKVNFGEYVGYIAVECGNVLGLGGALFAAIISVSALAKEEKDHTAEFLLTHPVKRSRAVLEKLLSVYIRVLILNLIVAAVMVAATYMIGEKPDAKLFFLLMLAYFLMQIEIASVCFGISAFMRRGEIGIGLGFALLMYFLNIIANLTKDAEWLKYVTPFAFADGTSIASSMSIEWKYAAVGLALAVAGVIAAFVKYGKKDIR